MGKIHGTGCNRGSDLNDLTVRGLDNKTSQNKFEPDRDLVYSLGGVGPVSNLDQER